jgi:hypothetical protein
MGKETRRGNRAQVQEKFGELIAPPARRRGDSASEIAESFRSARKALELAARDLVELKHRVTKPTSR